MNNPFSRRRFLVDSATGLTSLWIATHWPGIISAQAHAKHAASSESRGFEFFSPENAAEIEAMCAQIIPSDDTPGAREARVVYFIDRALTTFDSDKQPLYTQGIVSLQNKTREMFPSAAKFSSLSSEQQIQLLTSIEKTTFFETVRVHTVIGFLSNPEYGGNHDKVGWKLIGFEDNFAYEPPFGYYDANHGAE
jgi:gluconate 2-dehydrogenase gamma chain